MGTELGRLGDLSRTEMPGRPTAAAAALECGGLPPLFQRRSHLPALKVY
jgi:hypothetical protein